MRDRIHTLSEIHALQHQQFLDWVLNACCVRCKTQLASHGLVCERATACTSLLAPVGCGNVEGGMTRSAGINVVAEANSMPAVSGTPQIRLAIYHIPDWPEPEVAARSRLLSQPSEHTLIADPNAE